MPADRASPPSPARPCAQGFSVGQVMLTHLESEGHHWTSLIHQLQGLKSLEHQPDAWCMVSTQRPVGLVAKTEPSSTSRICFQREICKCVGRVNGNLLEPSINRIWLLLDLFSSVWYKQKLQRTGALWAGAAFKDENWSIIWSLVGRCLKPVTKGSL